MTFTSKILPPYLRKTRSIEELIPWLYLKGISTGDFSEALAALLGPNAKGLSATTIVRLKECWKQEYLDWSKRSLKTKRYASELLLECKSRGLSTPPMLAVGDGALGLKGGVT